MNSPSASPFLTPTSPHSRTKSSSVWKVNMSKIKADLVLGDPEDRSKITLPEALPGPLKGYLGNRMKCSNPRGSLSGRDVPLQETGPRQCHPESL